MVRTTPWRAQGPPAIGHRDAEVTSRDAEGDCHSAGGLGATVALTELTTPEREH